MAQLISRGGQQQGSFLSKALPIGVTKVIEGALGLPGSVISGIQGLAENVTGIRSPAKALGIPTPPTTENIKEYITKPGAEKLLGQYPEPQGFGQETLAGIAEMLPYIASGGLGAVARASAGIAAGQGAKQLGLGPLGQAIASFTPATAETLFKNIGGIGGIKTLARKEMEQAYDRARLQAPKREIDATPLKKIIYKEWDKLPISGLTEDQQKEVRYQLTNLNENILNNKINVQNAWDQKKHFNDLLKKAKDEKLENFWKRTVGAINDQILQPAAKQYPKFGKAFNKAEDLYKSLDAPNFIRGALENNLSLRRLLKNPLAQLGAAGVGASALFSGNLLPIGLTAGTLGLGYTTRTILRAVDFAKRPEAQKLMKRIASATAENNKPLTAQLLSQYNKAADHFEKQNKNKAILLKPGKSNQTVAGTQPVVS